MILNQTHKTACAQRIPASRESSGLGCFKQRSCRGLKVGLGTWGSPAAAAAVRGEGGGSKIHMKIKIPSPAARSRRSCLETRCC